MTTKDDDLKADIAVLKANTEQIKNHTTKLLEAVYGENGLTTKTALHGASLRRLWSAVVLMFTGLIGFCFWIFRSVAK